MIKLMINDITSMWQTGNHGDATLNKHYVPAGLQRKGARKRERERERERGRYEMRKEDREMYFF